MERDFLGLSIIIICIIAIGIMIMAYNTYNSDCLEKIGRKICYENNLVFDSILINMPPVLYCKKEISSFDLKEFEFQEKELKECKKF